MSLCRTCKLPSADFPAGGGGNQCRKCFNAYRTRLYKEGRFAESNARRNGRQWPPLTPRQRDEKKFWSLVKKTETCWLWIGPRSEDGYGTFSSRTLRRRLRAHRFSWFLEHGKLPKLLACHKCDIPLCIRPGHLFEGTHSDNMEDKDRKGRHWIHVGTPDFRGEKNARSKLTGSQVIQIRNRALRGESRSSLAREHGVSVAVISGVCLKKSWRHVGGPDVPKTNLGCWQR